MLMKRKHSLLACLGAACLCLCAACGSTTQPAPTDAAGGVTTPAPVVDESWKQLYTDFFAQNLKPVSGLADDFYAYQLQSGDLLDIDASALAELYWVDSFALCDLNLDGVPELILNQGEVEKEMYAFTPRDGKVAFVSHCLSGNQNHLEAAALYMDKQTGEKVWYSESLTGTGAGSWYEFGKIDPKDFSYTVLRSYGTDYDPATDTYQPTYSLEGKKVDEATFEQAEQSFADAHEKQIVRPFNSLSDDPSITLAQAIGEYTAP